MSGLKYNNINSTVSNYEDNEITCTETSMEKPQQTIKFDPVSVNITVFGNDISVKHPSKMGRLHTFLFINDEPLITIGPQFRLCMMLFSGLLVIELITQVFIMPHLNIVYRVLGSIIYAVQVISQFYTALINAGIPSKNNYISSGVMKTLELGLKFESVLEEKYFICKHCNVMTKIKRYPFHCDDCNICHEGFDHHCMWIGKCIAKNNLRSFWLFIGSTVVLVLYSVFLLFAFLIILAL